MRYIFRSLVLSFVVVVTAVGQTPAEAISTPPIPPDLDGKWAGELRHDGESAEVGFSFNRESASRVIVQLWCPNLNVYGSPIALLKFADGRFTFSSLPDAPLSFDHGALSGALFSSDVTFVVHRGDHLPVEPALPDAATGPSPAWTYRAGGPLWTSPVIAEGTAYLGDSNGTFHAINLADGKPRWTFAARAALFGNAAVTSDAVYFAGDNGQLFKLDRFTGREVWRADIGGSDFTRSLPTATAQEWDASAAAPIVDRDEVFIGSVDGALRAFDAATGKLLWQFKTGGKIRAAALATSDRIYFGSFDHFVYALARRTGALAWRFDTGSAVTTPPVLADGKIVIGTRDRATLFALDSTDGHPVWKIFYWFSWVESAPVLVDGRLYIGSSDSRRVRVIDPRDGKVIWSAQVWGWCWGTPVVVGDTVYYATAGTPKYFMTQRASIGALNRRTGALKWRKPIPLVDASYVSGISGSLAFADGKILAASIDGTLTAYPVE